MKKALSLLLSLVLLFTAIPNINLIVDAVSTGVAAKTNANTNSASAAVPTATTVPDIEPKYTIQPVPDAQNILDVSVYQFISDVYLDRSGLYEGVENIEAPKGLLEYYYEYDGAMQIQCDVIRQDKDLVNNLATWEKLTFGDDVGELATNASVTTRYEVILLELLKTTLKDASFREKLNNSVAATAAAPAALLQQYYAAQGLTKTELAQLTAEDFSERLGQFKQISSDVNILVKEGKLASEIFVALELGKQFGELDADGVKDLVAKFKDKKAIDRIAATSKDLSGASFIIGLVSDISDVVKNMALYSSLSDVGDSYISFLNVLSGYCNGNTNFQKAISNVKTALSSSWNSSVAVLGNYLNNTTEDLVQLVWDCGLDVLKNAFPAFGIVMLAYDIAIDLANFSFGTDDKLEKLYVSIAFSDIYVAIQQANKACRNTYLSSPTNYNAKLFVAATDMLFAVLLADCDYASSYWYEVINKGVVTKFFTDKGTIENIESGIKTCENLKKERKKAFDLTKRLSISLYLKALKSADISVDTEFNTEDDYGNDILDTAPYLIASGTWGLLYWTLDANGLLTISGTGKMDYFSALSSTEAWEEYKDKIKTVSIEHGITSICDDAFYNCTSLTSITIPDSVTHIYREAFSMCHSLSSITIPDSVTYIGEEAFFWCFSLSSITIPDSVTYIGENAFHSCDSLTSITIGGSVTDIDENAFSYCESLTSINIPDSVTYIGERAFYKCKSLKSITVDSNNQYYTAEDGVLFNKTKTKLVCYPPSITNTFYAIPNSVTSIDASAFSWCKSLTSITIPDSVTSIGQSAFSDCTSLTSITLPDGITSVDYATFSDCTSLTSITVPHSVTSIGSAAFSRCTSLTSITIPDSVTSIDNHAFSQCESLTSITIPDSVTSIDFYAFEACSSLTSITLHAGITSIGAHAFSRCVSVTNVYIPDSVTYIGDYAFSGCLYLKSISIPDSVTYIGKYAFSWCNTLTSVTLPKNLTSISEATFKGCTSLPSIDMPNDITTIGESAFYGCTALTSVTIPNKVTSIAVSAFEGCNTLARITIPVSVSSIGAYAFQNCSNLNTVYYYGNSNQWSTISVSSYNANLLSSNIIYNYIPIICGVYKLNADMPLYETTNTESTVLEIIPTDTVIEVYATTDLWGKVRYNGKSGWIISTNIIYISDTDTPSSYLSQELNGGYNLKYTTSGLYAYTPDYGATIANGSWSFAYNTVWIATKQKDGTYIITDINAASGVAKNNTPTSDTTVVLMCDNATAATFRTQLVLGYRFTLDWEQRALNSVNLNEGMPFELVDSSDYTLNENFVTAKTIGITAASLKSQFKCDVSVFNISGVAVADTGYIGTGSTVVRYNSAGNEINRATVVIPGDISGDGAISTTDMMILRKLLSEESTEAYIKLAADITEDQYISTSDFLALRKHCNGSNILYKA